MTSEAANRVRPMTRSFTMHLRGAGVRTAGLALASAVRDTGESHTPQFATFAALRQPARLVARLVTDAATTAHDTSTDMSNPWVISSPRLSGSGKRLPPTIGP